MSRLKQLGSESGKGFEDTAETPLLQRIAIMFLKVIQDC